MTATARAKTIDEICGLSTLLSSRRPEPNLKDQMKLPDVYSDWKIMTGVVLIALGAGNWLMGIRKTSEYNHSVSMALESHSEPAYRSFEELDANKNQAALEPLIASQRQVSYATARMDFYHVTAITGRVLFAAGLM